VQTVVDGLCVMESSNTWDGGFCLSGDHVTKQGWHEHIFFFRVRLDGCSSINLSATRNTGQFIRINGKSRMPLSTFYRFRGEDFVTRDRNLTVQLHVRLERLPRFEAGEFCVYREREFTWFYMVNISAPSSLMVPPHAPGKKKVYTARRSRSYPPQYMLVSKRPHPCTTLAWTFER
jgi:hypothetical protein